MPTSNTLHVPAVLTFTGALSPKRILDIGVGMGTYGFLLRQQLDIMQERVDKNKWQVVIDGVEIFEAYRNPVWDYAYNQVRIRDVRDLLPTLEEYDLILCNDVLEHFQLTEARELLRRLLERGGTVIATTPNQDYPQGAWGGNEAETHLCLLQPSDFPHLITYEQTGITNCYVCSNNPRHIEILKRTAEWCPKIYQPRVPFLKRACRKLLRMVRY